MCFLRFVVGIRGAAELNVLLQNLLNNARDLAPIVLVVGFFLERFSLDCYALLRIVVKSVHGIEQLHRRGNGRIEHVAAADIVADWVVGAGFANEHAVAWLQPIDGQGSTDKLDQIPLLALADLDPGLQAAGAGLTDADQLHLRGQPGRQ